MDVTLGQRQEDAGNCWPANHVKSVSFSSVRNFVLKKEVEHSKGRHRTLASSYNMHTCVYTHSHTGVYIYNKLSHMFTRYSANTWLLIAPCLWCDLDVWLVSISEVKQPPSHRYQQKNWQGLSGFLFDSFSDKLSSQQWGMHQDLLPGHW